MRVNNLFFRCAMVLFMLSTGVIARSADKASPSRLTELSRQPIDPVMDQSTLGLGTANKPNGRMYRLRETPDGTHPIEVPRLWSDCELGIADAVEGGFVVLYRGNYWMDGRNSKAVAVMFDPKGNVRWELDLSRFMSRTDQLEVQDIRYYKGKLYFNEACQTYSSEAGGACSALVCVDPASEKLVFRTPSLISNSIFIIDRDRIFCGYGFTAEPDFLYILDAATGEILSRTPVDSAHDYLEIRDDVLHVTTYKSYYQFRVETGSR